MRLLKWLGIIALIGLGAGCQARHSADVPRTSHGGPPDSRAADVLRQSLTGMQLAAAARTQNIANAATPGYKKALPSFLAGGAVTVRRDMAQGSLAATEMSVDLAISGEGFFALVSTDEKNEAKAAYTRSGMFSVDEWGDLTWDAPGGWKLNPRIVFPTRATDITISSDGRVYCNVPGASVPMEVGRILIARFAASALSTVDGVSFTARRSPLLLAAGSDGLGTIIQGGLESSNVDLQNELKELAQLRNRFELTTRLLDVASSP